MKADDFLFDIRTYEINEIKHLFQKAEHVLEIGTGNGWQCQEIKKQVNQITTIDICECENKVKGIQYVQYDGHRFPFENSKFDIVFSSNVLEHIELLGEIHNEIKRVLTHNGLIIHVLPSTTWRFWTFFSHSLHILKFLWSEILTNFSPKSAINIQRIAIPHKHGVRGNIFSEHYYFSRIYWKNQFNKMGFDICKVSRINLFYTGYNVFGSKLSIKTRNRLSHWLGNSCNLFILKNH